MKSQRISKPLQTGLLLAAAGFFLLYTFHCPIYAFFGIPCPGCNMRSALFAALQGNWSLSFTYHAMLVPTCIAALLWLCLPKYRKMIVWLWIGCMLVYYVLRMVFLWNRFPMELNENALLFTLAKRLLQAVVC